MASTFPNQTEGRFLIPDFRFQSGEALPDFQLRYLTLGTPKRDAAGRVVNAVLMLHGTTGSSRQFLQPSVANELFGEGQPLDASRYFIILPDDIGHGGSSKPSDGLRSRFPRFGYKDSVRAQHRLVTEHFGIDRLRLVLGCSMGGMQAWLWAVRYAHSMDAIMPIACQPAQIAGRNLLFRRLIIEAIHNDADWQGGEYSSPPRRWLPASIVFTIMSDSPLSLQAQAPTREATEALFDRVAENTARTFDANDLLSWLEASWDYDPEPDLHTIKARVLAVNFADDMVNPPNLGIMERAIETVPDGRYVLIPESDQTKGHQTVFLAAVWKTYVRELLQSIG
ncbi:MAG: alpha/beta fold hydrolase [Betaproteobacteria bacterium]|nr:alpha/beta fold hydrolase [Betaproteobacteria bacterium]